MQLPPALHNAIENELYHLPPERLAQAVADLSMRYRAPHSRELIANDDHRLAYLATRLPATYAALSTVLKELSEVYEDEIDSLLDLGAGPGSSLWAVNERFPNINSATLLERDSATVKLGKRLAQNGVQPIFNNAQWQIIDLTSTINLTQADLVIISYTLGELSKASQQTLIDRAWQVTKKALVIVEPGTQRGFDHILAARKQLLIRGGFLFAPCPHQADCPLESNDWCHFSQRVERTRRHRQAKGVLPFEDEKYSYMIFTRDQRPLLSARIIRHPVIRMGHIHLNLCTKTGIARNTLSKKDGETYKRARKADWGDSWPDSTE